MGTHTHDDGRWFTPEYLSPRQRMTPEGFLLCEAVPIARTGTLIYADGEVPIDAATSGQIVVERTADEVFRAETLASFEGKPVTLSHPDDFVSPANWRELTVGITQNVRRGDGIEQDLMLADLLITDADGIREVREGLREVSCGYEADYEQLAPGRGRQLNIVGNHVALVERGRCGPRCAIGDSDEMKTKDAAPKRTWMDRVRTAFKAKDEAALEEALEEGKASTEDEDEEEEGKEKAKTGDALNAILGELKALNKRVGDMEAKMDEETKDSDEEDETEDEEEEGKTEDDVLEAEQAEHNAEAAGKTYTGDADLRSRAEILAPGITFPTRDAKAKTADHVCSCQRMALGRAMQTEDGKVAVEPFLLGRELKALTADQVASAFVGASELLKARNNARGSRQSITTKDFGRPGDVAAMNARNREFWKGQGR